MQRQGAILEADNVPSGELILLVPGSWASQPPELREINFCGLSPPAFDTLLEQPKQTKTQVNGYFSIFSIYSGI